MPIKIPGTLPAKAKLEEENIFVMDEARALSQEIRPLQIVILNLMPLKEETELQLLRAMSNTPLQLDITFLQVASHQSTHTAASHISKFYTTLDEIRHHSYDGMIITGAPVEQMEFEEVDYWEEMKEIFEWTKTHVTSTLHLCWGAQAALYYHYGIPKIPLPKKAFGVFSHHVAHRKEPLVRGFDDIFKAPHSRHTAVDEVELKKHSEIKILAESDEVGVFLAMSQDGKQIFCIGHPEYDRVTLDGEYQRDVKLGRPIELPKNYYENDDPNKDPVLSWRSHCNLLYSNWLNYYVYQVTPYILEDV
ncbi:MAG: homoserine O-succinyltransferase [Lachnospiraceae bacterium]|nr:homoserine O-succinyltransferase [Lachnospiraceae bacterium]